MKPNQKIDKRAGFLVPQRNRDTIVFVHGLNGHYWKTWGKFPNLLTTDKDLPTLDILLWGYKTSLFPGTKDIETEAAHLIGTLASTIRKENDVFLVGHSMGGLIILHGLVGEMTDLRAQIPPSLGVKWITLFASPISGVSAAAIVKHTVGRLKLLGRFINKQLRDLARGADCDALITEVYHRIYSPEMDDSAARRIPIRMIMATRDRAVDETDRKKTLARFRITTPVQLDQTHSSVKEPESHLDLRYRALSNDIQEILSRSFKILCTRCMSKDVNTSEIAWREMDERYGSLIEDRVKNICTDNESYEEVLEFFFVQVAKDAMISARPPFDIINRTVIIAKKKLKSCQ